MDCTILFADVVGSTRLYERLGDDEAQIVIAAAIQVMSRATLEHGGTVIKSIGDEIMCTFPEPAPAVVAAQEMFHGLDKGVDGPTGKHVLNIHAGLHWGSVVEEDGDVFGDAVNLAARMVQLAKPRQILTTEETIRMLGEDSGVRTRWVDRTIVKGKTEPTNVHEVVWEREALTIMSNASDLKQAITAYMKVTQGERVINVSIVRPTLTMGRQEHNDLVVDRHQTSRSHARIECRRGKFVLIDQSSNGTYVFPQEGEPIKLNREETYLSGKGVIGLGYAVEDGAPDSIHYEVSE